MSDVDARFTPINLTLQSCGGRGELLQSCVVRILIADDQKSVGMTLAALVERCGHEVVQVVGSGLEAIQAYSRLKPDLVLMDYSMPRLNGATACRMILSKEPNARVIIVSGVATNDTIDGSGALAVLPKPVGLEQLYAALYDAGSGTPSSKIDPP